MSGKWSGKWRQLDAINFFLADVRGGFGPYLGIYLLTTQQWSPAAIGLIATIAGLTALVFNAPAGALIDAIRWKRGIIVLGVTALAAGSVLVALWPSFWVVVTANTLMAVVGDVFGPAVAAITLGLVPTALFTWRMGRNCAFDHAGNVAIAVTAGVTGWWFGQQAVFFLVPLFALAVAASVLGIPARAIDHTRARGGAEDEHGSAAPICAALFHFANAPMLPLVGQKLALANSGRETVFMSACVIAAQLVMLPMALLVGARADVWGRKPFLIGAFIVLPLRGFLYTLSDHSAWLVAVQLLDGIGNGLFATLTGIVVADLMRGTGRYNLARGLVATVQGVGASLSNVIAGNIVVLAGYNTAFLALACIAALGLAVLAAFMPETGRPAPLRHPVSAPISA
jgi:MFS family permease